MRYGYFDNENREYVIDKLDIPTSWTNYLGVRDMCTVINHTAGGYTFYKSPEYHRVTRFRPNAIPMDRPGHYVYLRDDESSDYWSVSWQPVGKSFDEAKYKCRHGMSYTVYECDYKGIHAEQKLSVPIDDPVELWDVKIKNNSDKERNLSVFSYLEFSFHHIEMDNKNFQMSMYASGSSYEDGIIENDLFYEEFGYQYFTANFEADSFDCLRDKFIGSYRTEDNPIAVEKGVCSGSFEKGNNHCGALHKRITLAPGEEIRIVFMLGEGKREVGKGIREKYSNLENVDKAYQALGDFWNEKFEALQIDTPNEGMNTLINTWTLYQAEINVMFSRFASFIEVGGRTGLGYRDTSQDAMTVPHSNPEKCKQRIVELLRGLVSKGYGLHLFQPEWFDPDTDVKPFKSPTVVPTPKVSDMIHGLEDTCSDDALWLIPTIVEYIKETGEVEFLDEELTYADGGKGTVYEHMTKILDFSAEQVGATGVCKGLRADWNDCLNLGGGESALVSFLHYHAINNFLEIAILKDRREDIEKYEAMLQKVKNVCDEVLWDQEWYIRGITKNGSKIGTMEDEEGKIHLESNSWAVLSGAAPKDKGIKAMDSVYKYLFTPYGIMLNSPAYTKPNEDIGFVTRVYPGLKENASIFSHPNPWAWAAECKLGRGDRAMEFYNALCPYYQNDMIEIREAEPYSYCQFIMGKAHTAFGRARHPFMTGTGGWAYFSATRYMLGIRPQFDELIIDPCIPGEWNGFKAQRKWRGATYKIEVENPSHVMKGIKEISVDGIKVDKINIGEDGRTYNVKVVMG
ncbi:N,N'-diacetylchitobiose phosphorylase [Clostridium sp. NSJ-6]|uniref:N,N'-diacetylchitobiose phosphorylase n=1 Tax=Clostridium hominis TaxID=2763036 RepID=A0ABR7D8X8_9CLOT|nr:N,N'-diacetylchitobiose phosphorylase [Clostridium hominis]MBC5627842.1 N,N'-diacetylchitobiose phosphorylase [Clostridium hominis]MDU2672889.1 N,N'-diacetylchitobiose phosphorylase [Clostridium sp.]